MRAWIGHAVWNFAVLLSSAFLYIAVKCIHILLFKLKTFEQQTRQVLLLFRLHRNGWVAYCYIYSVVRLLLCLSVSLSVCWPKEQSRY